MVSTTEDNDRALQQLLDYQQSLRAQAGGSSVVKRVEVDGWHVEIVGDE